MNDQPLLYWKDYIYFSVAQEEGAANIPSSNWTYVFFKHFGHKNPARVTSGEQGDTRTTCPRNDTS